MAYSRKMPNDRDHELEQTIDQFPNADKRVLSEIVSKDLLLESFYLHFFIIFLLPILSLILLFPSIQNHDWPKLEAWLSLAVSAINSWLMFKSYEDISYPLDYEDKKLIHVSELAQIFDGFTIYSTVVLLIDIYFIFHITPVCWQSIVSFYFYLIGDPSLDNFNADLIYIYLFELIRIILFLYAYNYQRNIRNQTIPYGSTESSPVVTHTSIKDNKKHRLESVGRPIDHLEIKVVDPITGDLKKIGETGEVCSRGHSNFAGYWAQKQKTDEVLDQNRWYHSGDMGFMDEFGYLFINGRIKDMIIRGGENIYPKEIEDFLMSNPSIADAHVVGIPHERLGEDLVAYIKLKDSRSLNHNTVKEFCKGKISHFKIPQNIEFVDDFPRTVTGKVQKFKLREIAKKQFKK